MVETLDPTAGDDATERVRRRRMSGGRFAVSLALCLAGIAILCSLGQWQVHRLAWKQDLLATIEARRHAEPITLDALAARAAAGEPIDYVPVTLTGEYFNGDERYFFSTFEGRSGWNVYTPLRTADGALVFVNRGFVPYERRDPGSRPDSRPQGTVTLTGLARTAPPAKPGYFVPDNEPAEETYYWRDLGAMAAGVEGGADAFMPFFVDAGPTPRGGPALPQGGTTQVTMPNNHLQYALTWYGLAAVLAVMTAIFVWRHWRAGSRAKDRRASARAGPPPA